MSVPVTSAPAAFVLVCELWKQHLDQIPYDFGGLSGQTFKNVLCLASEQIVIQYLFLIELKLVWKLLEIVWH